MRKNKTSCKPSVEVKESSYIIKFDFASYDELPKLNDIVSALNDGLRDYYPNCSINIIQLNKEKVNHVSKI